MELALERDAIVLPKLGRIVSILVFVELALERKRLPLFRCNLSVSILVFVELALEPDLRGHAGWRKPFQSLFLWNWRSNVTRSAQIEDAMEFQSLFLWNWRSNYITYTWLHGPCQFQSLFLWNWRSNSVGTVGFRRQDTVSILVFVELALERRRPSPYRGDTGVSILVFVELALERDAGDVILFMMYSFRSLFLWNWRSNLVRRSGRRLQRGVSILVFVELALEPRLP